MAIYTGMICGNVKIEFIQRNEMNGKEMNNNGLAMTRNEYNFGTIDEKMLTIMILYK